MDRQSGAIAQHALVRQGVVVSTLPGSHRPAAADDIQPVPGERSMTTMQSMQGIFKANFDLAPELLQREAVLEDLEIDSLSMIEVLFAVEDEFKIVVPQEPAAWRGQTRTFGDLVDYVDKLITAQHAAMAGGEVPA
jgi:acyl carrier protein